MELLNLAAQQELLRRPLFEVLISHAQCFNPSDRHQDWVLPAMRDVMAVVLELQIEDSRRSDNKLFPEEQNLICARRHVK